MKQCALPTNENNTLADTLPPVWVEIGQDHAISLIPKSPTATHDPLPALEARLRPLINQSRKRSVRAAWFAPVFYGLSFLAALLSPDQMLQTSPFFYLSTVFLFIVALGYLLHADARLCRKFEPICRAVIELDDVRTVGLLVDALKMNYGNIQRTVTDALIELLPRLQPEEVELLNVEQRALLSSKLSSIPKSAAKDRRASTQAAHSRSLSFRVAILQAFTHVGDSSALSIVEKLAQEEAKTVEQRRIQEAAQECLPALRLRAKQERDPHTLLRAASSSADANSETLLRAATGTQETPPEQLLRPSSHNL